jgi:hypothetical protein
MLAALATGCATLPVDGVVAASGSVAAPAKASAPIASAPARELKRVMPGSSERCASGNHTGHGSRPREPGYRLAGGTMPFMRR